ncbi:DNA polymerase III subunit gamma/tau [Patescibacteria group bacterium]|nr:DNA polymerase III subunit gamma/tau [Patescibacteria group bacterium]
MPSVLYRKYRAQNFDQLIGQDHITKLLKNAIKTDQIAQAYLFVGSRGTGKTSTARILAKAVNCLNPTKDGNPCNECSVCKAITNGSMMDLIEIDAASNRGIDQIRELKEKIEFSPSEGKYKVYIIDEVHMLTTEAFNALLKTLEEPPAHVIFMLATTDVHKLPPTILSRCQRYDFRLGTDTEIAEVISSVSKEEGIGVDEKALDLLVQNAKGSYRDALSLLDVVYSGQEKGKKQITEEEVRNILGLPDFDKVTTLLSSLEEGNGKKALEIVEGLEEKGVNLQQFTSYTLSILREILVGKIKGKLGKDYEMFSNWDIRMIHRVINLFLEAENRIKYTSNQALVLEMIIPEMMKDEPVPDNEVKIVNTDVKNKIAPQEEVKKVEPKNEEKQKEEVKEEPIPSEVAEDSEEEEDDVDGEELSVDDIKKRWESFVLEVKPFNNHLYAFLENAKVVGFNEGVLTFEVPFSFHKDRIEIPKSREVIACVFQKVYGSTCKIVCNVNDQMKSEKKSDAEFVLRNVPVATKKEAPKEEKPDKASFYKAKKPSAEIEAIFEGM